MTVRPRIELATAAYLRRLNVPSRTSEEEMGAADAREFNRKELVAEFGPQPVVGAMADHLAGGVPVRVFRPAGDAGVGPVVLYIHGGGWTVGDLDSHAGVSRALCALAGVTVVAVDYRLAPEHRYPAAVEDCEAALEWLTAHADDLGVDPRAIAVVGDSSGGNLAAVIAQRATAAGVQLRCQVLVYPPVDSRSRSKSFETMATGYGLEAAEMLWYWSNYLGEAPKADDPGHSPLAAHDLRGLPPALILTAELDPLRDEAEEYGAALVAADVPVSMRRFDGTIHGFFRMPGTIPLGRVALESAAKFLHSRLSVTGPLRSWDDLSFEVVI
ncbi:alpha/beta hydrolase [Actinomadura luteofluorescens]|uniref:alpha/beta hydrolase n=1 Tax=Actinomadura luteofluorescens TaxID=46163 RepID=UPI003D937A7F